MFETPHSRWRALEIRNPLAAIAFLYGVKTTHIYCRPTCPSRLARKANVVFFDTASEAECAGFRACKRCKPSQNDFEHQAGHKKAVRKACEMMDAAGGVLTLESLACSVGLSPRYFHGVFKTVMGLTPSAYAMKIRKENTYRKALPSQDGHKTCVRSEGPPGSNGKEDDRRTLPSLDFSFADLPFDEALASGADTGFGRASPEPLCCGDVGSCFQCIAFLPGNRFFDDVNFGSGNDSGVPPTWELPNLSYEEGIVAYYPGDIPTAPNLDGNQNEGDFTALLLTAGDLPSDFGSHFDNFLFACN